MTFKQYFIRMLRYIKNGQPIKQVKVEVSQIVGGKTLNNKRVAITGGGRGIGYSIAENCIAEGAKVCIIGRNEEVLAKSAGELKCDYFVYDISNAVNVDNLIKNICEKIGGIDCLVSNAGISLHEGVMLNVRIEDFDQQIDTNLRGAYFLAQAFVRYCIINEQQGNIVFISSERGHQCDDIPYGLTKAALNSLTRGISRRYYRNGIRVNAVAPGITVSDMTNLKHDDNLYSNSQVAERFFLPEEVATVVGFLLSDASKCISGEVIACDAGQYLSSYM